MGRSSNRTDVSDYDSPRDDADVVFTKSSPSSTSSGLLGRPWVTEYSSTVPPNPLRRHTRGRRGKGLMEPSLCEVEWRKGKERETAKRIRVARKERLLRGLRHKDGKAREVAVDWKKGGKMGAQMAMARRMSERRITGRLRSTAHDGVYCGTTSAPMEKHLSRKEKAMERDVMKTEARPEKRTPASSLPSLVSIVQQYKRHGRLPNLTAADLASLPSSSRVDGKMLARVRRALLLREGIEPNPGWLRPSMLFFSPLLYFSYSHLMFVCLMGANIPTSPTLEFVPYGIRLTTKTFDHSCGWHGNPNFGSAPLRLASQKDGSKRPVSLSIVRHAAETTQHELGELPEGSSSPEPTSDLSHESEILADFADHFSQQSLNLVYAIYTDPMVSSLVTPWACVNYDELPPVVVPHTLHVYTFIGSHIDNDLRHPYYSEMKPYSDFGVILTYRHEARRLGFLYGSAGAVEEDQIAIPYDLLALMNHKGLNQSNLDLCTLLSRVEAFVSSHATTVEDYWTSSNVSFAQRCMLLAALLFVWRGRSDQPTVEDLVRGTLQGEIKKAAFIGLRPEGAAPGTYVKGYSLSPSEILGNVIPTVQGGVKQTKASVEAAARAADKAWVYCRSIGPTIKGLVPSFPDPFSFPNVRISAVKRLLTKIREPAEWAGDMVGEIYRMVQDEVVKIPDIVPSLDDAYKYFVSNGGGVNWSQRQFSEFYDGMRAAYDLRIGKNERLCEILEWAKEFTSMVKQELYSQAEFKACRFISIPCMRFRGFTYAVYHPIEVRIKQSVFGQFLVKGMRPEEIQRKFTHILEEGREWLESDFTSFESNMRGIYLKIENSFFSNLSCLIPSTDLSALLASVYDEGVGMSNKYYKLLSHGLRLSGTYWTSIGNALGNFAFIAAASLRSAGVTVDDMRKMSLEGLVSLLGWAGRCIVEGDDGVFCMDSIPFSKLGEVAVEMGLRLKTRVCSGESSLHFCGNVLAPAYQSTVIGLRSVIKDPREVLSKMTHVFNSSESAVHDNVIMVGRCLSQLIVTPSLPIVSSYCRAFLAHNKKGYDTFMRAASSVKPPRWIKEFSDRARGYGLPLKEWLLGGELAIQRCDREARVAVEVLYGISVAAQEQAERAIVRGISVGHRVLTVDCLKSPLPLISRLSTRVRGDARAIASETAKNLTSAWTLAIFYRDFGAYLFAYLSILTVVFISATVVLPVVLVLWWAGLIEFPLFLVGMAGFSCLIIGFSAYSSRMLLLLSCGLGYGLYLVRRLFLYSTTVREERAEAAQH